VYSSSNPVIYTYDLSNYYNQNRKAAEVYDEALFLSTLQGIVNKKGPRFYIYHDRQLLENVNQLQAKKNDKDILDELIKPGQWLDGFTVIQLNTIDEVMNQFKNDIAGIVTWDPRVEATVNIATTVAGVENTPAVMYGGKLYNKLTSNPYNLSVIVNLNGLFTGVNAKTDAYYWAKTNYIDNNKVSCKMMSILEDGYARNADRTYITSRFVEPRDYLVKNSAFVFDLSPWNDERPNDSPEQTLGSDYNCFISLLSAGQNKWGNGWPIEVVGFVPWWHKYSTYDGKGSHDAVSSEWKVVEILSSYGATLSQIVDTLGASNASFMSWAPFPEKVPPKEAPLRVNLQNKTYICFFNGDHDGGTINHGFNSAWMDPRRGQIPIGWGIVPGIMNDFTALYNYLRETATKNDFFWAGASGAGYSNPGYISSNIWKQYNQHIYSRTGYTMTGFILNGNAGAITSSIEAMYRDFSGDGICGLGSQVQSPKYDVRSGNVAIGAISLDIDRANVDAGVSAIYNYTRTLSNPGKSPNFIVVRSSFALPSVLEQVYKKLKTQYPAYNYEVVDPYTLFSLIRQKDQGQLAYDAVVIDIQAPERMVCNEKYDVSVTLRNVGTYTWTEADLFRLGASPYNQFMWSDYKDGGYSNSVTDQRVFLSSADIIEPQQIKTFSFKITAPSTAGTYNLSTCMVRDGVTWFGSTYTKSIQVVNASEMEARLVSIDAPDEIVQGQRATVSFTFKNIGTSTWTAADNYRLGSLVLTKDEQTHYAIPNVFEWTDFADGGYSNSVSDQRAFLSVNDSIAPGQSKTFTFDIIAPYGRGKFILSGKMVREGYGWFGDNAIKEITVVPANRLENDSKCIAVTVPEYISPNEKVNVSVSVRNTGTSIWSKTDGFSLAATSSNQFIFNDMQHGGISNSPTNQKVYLSNHDSIKPEESKTFNFSITAPSSPGTYKIGVIMTKDGEGNFGQQIEVEIKVKNALRDALFVEDDIPEVVAAGSEVIINLNVINTGTESWKESSLHRLGAAPANDFQFVFLDSSEGYSNSAKDQRVKLPGYATVIQGGETGFTIRLKAPDTTGTYTFAVRMVRDGVEWFGPTFSKTITVVDGYRKMINVGGNSLTDEKGYHWLADQPYTSGSWGYTGSSTVLSTTSSITVADKYNRYGSSQYKTLRKGTMFGYRFDNVPNGTYKVTLFFADHESTSSSQNLINVDIEGYEAIKALDVYKNRCGRFKAMIAEDIFVNVHDGVLNIDLSSYTGNAFLNGVIVERIK